MLGLRRKPVIKRFTTLSHVNEPLARLVEPEPPRWGSDRARRIASSLIRFLRDVAVGVAAALGGAYAKGWLFRRPVREA